MQDEENGSSYGQLVIGSFMVTTRPLLHHVSCRVFFDKHEITEVTMHLYSPDLVPFDFWHFPKLKSPLEGKRFQTAHEIQENMIGQLMMTPTKYFAECFEQWKRCGRTV